MRAISHLHDDGRGQCDVLKRTIVSLLRGVVFVLFLVQRASVSVEGPLGMICKHASDCSLGRGEVTDSRGCGGGVAGRGGNATGPPTERSLRCEGRAPGRAHAAGAVAVGREAHGSESFTSVGGIAPRARAAAPGLPRRIAAPPLTFPPCFVDGRGGDRFAALMRRSHASFKDAVAQRNEPLFV